MSSASAASVSVKPPKKRKAACTSEGGIDYRECHELRVPGRHGSRWAAHAKCWCAVHKCEQQQPSQNGDEAE
jgi:hypothetical protein